jgi:hypothetical protein
MANNPKVLINLNNNEPSFVSADITPFFQSKNVRVDLSGFVPVNNFSNYDYDTVGFAGVGVVPGTTTVSPVIITLSKPVREFEFTIFAPNARGHQFVAYDSSNAIVDVEEIVTETEFYTTRRIQLATTDDRIKSIRLISPTNDVVDYFINGIRAVSEDILNPPTPVPTPTPLPGAPPTSTASGLTPNSVSSRPPAHSTGTDNSSISSAGGVDSPKLTAYIEAEIRAEVQKQYPELNSMVPDANMLRGLNVLSVALSRAIKKYLNNDVKTEYLTLETDPVTLIGGAAGGSYISPNPHNHPIIPHRHDIVAP